MSKMPKNDERPWWKKKTNWGLFLIAAGKTMAFFPATMPFAPIVDGVGMILAGYGVADRITKK